MGKERHDEWVEDEWQTADVGDAVPRFDCRISVRSGREVQVWKEIGTYMCIGTLILLQRCFLFRSAHVVLILNNWLRRAKIYFYN